MNFHLNYASKISDMTCKEYAYELQFSCNKSKLRPQPSTDNLWRFIGRLVSTAFIEVRCNEDKYDELCELVSWLSPLADYQPAVGDRGFYIDNSKRTWSLSLRTSTGIKINNSKDVLYLLSLGFRIGKYHDYKTIFENVPKIHRKLFKEGFQFK
jgi:hypothetical protein